jgi:anti-anti-sigma regulatory factor
LASREESPQGPSTIEIGIGPRIDRTDIPALCDRARALMKDASTERLICDVGEVFRPDAVTVDALARLQLTARRLGCRLSIRHPRGELQELLALMGLSEVFPLWNDSGFGSWRQTEEREEPRGVEEEGDSADPTA